MGHRSWFSDSYFSALSPNRSSLLLLFLSQTLSPPQATPYPTLPSSPGQHPSSPYTWPFLPAFHPVLTCPRGQQRESWPKAKIQWDMGELRASPEAWPQWAWQALPCGGGTLLELGLFPMPLSLVRPAPLPSCPLTAPAGGGQGKEKEGQVELDPFGIQEQLARALGQRRAGFQAASLLPDRPHWGCLYVEGRA